MPRIPRIDFDATPYELTHGCTPRGRGHWDFCPFHLLNDANRRDHVIAFWDMTLGEAKKQAAEHIRGAMQDGRIHRDWGLWAILP